MPQKWDYFVRNSGNLNSDGHEALMRLRGARAAAKTGRYEQALEGYVWFHENELNAPRMGGARWAFSFFADWIQLASVYPPARTALEEIRDRKSKSLLNGIRDVQCFHDVASINKYLECERATYELFVRLNSSFPILAGVYASLAMPAIISSGDFELAKQHMPPPAEELQRLREVFQMMSERVELQTRIRMYVERLNLILGTLRGIGDTEQADRVLTSALESFESPEFREAVRTALNDPGNRADVRSGVAWRSEPVRRRR